MYGLSLFECNEVYVDSEMNEEDLYITVLHEFFHYFFKDECDNRKHATFDPNKDPIERRAENSAKNMLLWYKYNQEQYSVFKEFVGKFPKKTLKKNEL